MVVEQPLWSVRLERIAGSVSNRVGYMRGCYMVAYVDALAVARHFEQALTDVAVAIAPQVEHIGSAVASYSEPGSWLNQCWNFGMHGTATPDDVDRIIAFYEARGCAVRVGVPNVADRSAIEALSGRGFEIDEFINMLLLDLTSGTSTPPAHPAPPGFEIHRVDKSDDEAVESWAELSTRGFNEGEPAPLAEVRTAAQAVRSNGAEGYVASLHGEPAAAAAVSLNDAHGTRSAGLFATSVLPAFRRLGLQQHLLAARLDRAHELGATFATIGSNPGIPTERNAAHFGFELSYVKAVLVRR